MKKSIVILAAVLLAICALTGFAACDDNAQTVRVLTALDDNGLAFSELNIGDFIYKSSLDQDGDYPDVTKVNFQVQYEDGSVSPVAKDDAELKIKEITRNGSKVENAPEVYDVGNWKYVFEYKGKTATVSFNILPSTEAVYTISGIPEQWDYSLMPDLTATVSVEGYPDPLNFSGENANITLYYITAADYSEAIENPSFNINDIITVITPYSPYSQSGVFMPAGEYYMFAKMKQAGNYADQITDFKQVTVNKELLSFTVPENLYTSYYFSAYNGPGNVKLSSVYTPALAFEATNAAGQKVMLTAGDWLNPDEEISAANADKKYGFSLIPVADENNYDTRNLVAECTVEAFKGYLGAEPEQFIFDDNAALTVDRTVELDGYGENGFAFFNSSVVTNDETMLNSFFKMVDVRDVSGKKLPVYSYETAPEPLFAGDEGAIAKVVRTYSFPCYDYYIVLNDPVAIGDYTFTVSLIDDVNFRWGDYSRDYGSEPITLNYTVTGNDPEAYFEYNSSTLADGKFEFSLYIAEEAYDPSLLKTFKVTPVQSYTDEWGNLNKTDDGLVMHGDFAEVTAGAPSDGVVTLTVKVPVTLPESTTLYFTSCFGITMQTAENYKSVEVTAHAELQKQAGNANY